MNADTALAFGFGLGDDGYIETTLFRDDLTDRIRNLLTAEKS
ncbi:hypothetical protein NZK35_17520 [Stieleria sp. ICT_E10.1]|nr:hypothetical protein [Stieleria sedimenti]MCS7468455.1 hypothetical protein [Stieleria sedimenti]